MPWMAMQSSEKTPRQVKSSMSGPVRVALEWRPSAPPPTISSSVAPAGRGLDGAMQVAIRARAVVLEERAPAAVLQRHVRSRAGVAVIVNNHRIAADGARDEPVVDREAELLSGAIVEMKNVG
jgi:hypothetical protein